MNQQKIGLKFLMRGGAFMLVVVTEAEAREAIQKWCSFPPFLDANYFPSLRDAPNSWGWAIRSDDIVGMHTIGLDQLQQAQQPGSVQPYNPLPGRFPPGTSGLPN